MDDYQLRYLYFITLPFIHLFTFTGISNPIYTVNLPNGKILDDDVKGGGALLGVALRRDSRRRDESVPRGATDGRL